MNIYEKINAIMGEVKSLQKDGKVAFGNTKYNFLSEAKTTETFRPFLVKYKLVLLPVKVKESKEGQITHGEYTYKLVNAENPEEFEMLMSGGQGHDSADKGSGKASSYAYKYLLWRTFAVPSNDDPDSVSSAEIENGQEKTKQINDATEWDRVNKKLMDTAKECGFLPKQVEDRFSEVYGKHLFNATIKELQEVEAKLHEVKKK